MKKIVAFLCLSIFVIACKNNNGAIPIGLHEVTAKESVNTSEYTYVRVLESGKEQWIAIPLAEIKIGETYYYQGGMVMENFESKELKRTFESLVLVEGLSKDKNITANASSIHSMGKKTEEKHTNVNASNLEKLALKIVKPNGGISIAELYANKDNYAGKKVKISGVVTKFSPEIMKKNWLHIQDGTESDGKFDLTATSNEKHEVGDTITLEGKIATNKDFGYGYFYEVLLEEAVKIK